MGSRPQHRLEGIAQRLSERIKARGDVMVESLAPPGGAKPFSRMLSKGEALAWWRAHRFDEKGAEVLSYLKPQDVLALDVALQELVSSEQGLPEEG